MTEQEINIAIAKARNVCFERRTVCPWCNGNTPYEAGDDYGITLWAECKNCSNTGEVEPYFVGIPDYCNNLNAMHKEESALSPEQVADYVFNLHLHTIGADLTAYDGDMSKAAPYFFPVIHATARHRAEAFLRTLGLWED